MGCTFCATGTMGLKGDLTAGEIVEQLWHARSVTSIRNVVFMVRASATVLLVNLLPCGESACQLYTQVLSSLCDLLLRCHATLLTHSLTC